jgi:hypothetical protein
MSIQAVFEGQPVPDVEAQPVGKPRGQRVVRPRSVAGRRAPQCEMGCARTPSRETRDEAVPTLRINRVPPARGWRPQRSEGRLR